ncbi:MAG: isoaspartyl peptidase/L-asparaginase [Salinivirgaceae bacterium]|nr:isoaspartyl peptidase/L-asparaginase [Salinivirgaceae bacterium]
MASNPLKKATPYLGILLLFVIPALFIPFIKKSQMLHKEQLSTTVQSVEIKRDTTFAIVIHGGAGISDPTLLPDTTQAAIKGSLTEALELGKAMLLRGDSAHIVVASVIVLLENNTLFNAGKGAVLDHSGKASLDASIMTGWDKNAGAVAGATTIKNPILAALHILQNSPHVILSGMGANKYAKQNNLTTVPNSYFITQESKNRLKRSIEADKSGTVGCVVRDKYGNLVAGTSTGGMNNKKFDRIGDSPIIGAGTWADNSTCAISCTGWGEYFIRTAAAHEVASIYKYQNVSIQKAAYEVIFNQIEPLGGYGALIAIDCKENITVESNTTLIFHAWYNKNGQQKIALSK